MLQPAVEPASSTTQSACRRISPWFWVPVIYGMQAIPVTMVSEVSTLTLKDLGFENLLIVTWTSLVTLPWTLKLFWAPLVDLNFTKRGWVVAMQTALTLALIAWAGCVAVGGSFGILILLLLFLAILSATHDISCDGLYLMSLDRRQQAFFCGVQTTCYRLGRLFCTGVLVWLAGALMGRIGWSASHAWGCALGTAGVLYGVAAVWNRYALPAPSEDRPKLRLFDPTNLSNLGRTLLVVIIGLGSYFFVRSGLFLLGAMFHRLTGVYDIAWVPPSWEMSRNDVHHYASIAMVSGSGIVFLIWLARRWLQGTEMGTAFSSFVHQSGFFAILGFIVFYRFGEAMISKMSPLFYRDSIEKGGLGISTEVIGLINGVAGVGGILLGGIVGAWFISRRGLRKSLVPLILSMSVPNLLYVWASVSHPPVWMIFGVAFVDQFGYGFGFAGYIIYLMYVAQRGNFQTTHYAIGTGLGMLTIILAGIVSGIVQQVFGYTGMFIVACLAAIPGMLILWVIPMDNEQTRTLKPIVE
ncbi:MAG: hypothetical protein KatS3mg104_0747 [Phycisphaerae bacterium]|nr:MAG: hypothetical protein KatS3mg104_0747 [Phycisphaerae bacterium]